LTRSRGLELEPLYAELGMDLDGRMILRALEQND